MSAATRPIFLVLFGIVAPITVALLAAFHPGETIRLIEAVRGESAEIGDGNLRIGDRRAPGAHAAASPGPLRLGVLPSTNVRPNPSPSPTPVLLHISDIGLSGSSVVPVGVRDGGDMEIPPPSTVGWYRFGSAPGANGSTVLAAHIAYDGADGVFRYLTNVTPGSFVEVIMDEGTVVTYRIERIIDYEKSKLPTWSLFSDAGPDRLVLITCGGDFDHRLRSYRSNTVAYATRI